MASKTRRGRALIPITTLAVLLTACSGSTGRNGATLPDPQSGKAVAFELNKLSTRYDISNTVDEDADSLITSDRSGNIYLLNRTGTPFNVLRMTPQGEVSLFAMIASLSFATGMTATPDGGLLIGDDTSIVRVDEHGAVRRIAADHRFNYPNPVGVRPDGTVIIAESHTVWSLKGGKATPLYRTDKGTETGSGAVDASGTAYIRLAGTTIAGMLALSPGKAPQHLQISGNLPGSRTPISGLDAITLAPAPSGGFYVMAVDNAITKKYVVHVRGTTATVLAQGPVNGSCAAGKQYDALNIPCSMPLFVVPSKHRILLMGLEHQVGTDPYPALAIRADTA